MTVANPAPAIPLRRRAQRALERFPHQLVYSGRKVGRIPGGHIADLVALRQTIILCDSHHRKFDAKRAGYFEEKKIQCGGQCDACREEMPANGHLFIHEDFLGEAGSWVPR